MKISEIKAQWEEGRRHGFPPCCRARWIFDRLRPSFLDNVFPSDVAARLRPLLSIRYGLADGMVPCEYHAARFLIDGDRTRWRRRRTTPITSCCDTFSFMLEDGIVRLETVEPDEVISEKGHIWMMSATPEEGISISRCPWCGTDLQH